MCVSTVHHLLTYIIVVKKTLLVVLLTAAGKYNIRVELTLNHRTHELLYIQQPDCFYTVAENNLLLLKSLTLFFTALICTLYR